MLPTPFPQKGYRESQGYQCESDPLIKPFCSPAIGSSFRPILRADARPAPRFQFEKLDIMMERPHRLGSFSINIYIYYLISRGMKSMFSDDSARVGTYDTFYGYGTVGTVGTVRWAHRTVPTVPTVPYPLYPPYHTTVPNVPHPSPYHHF